MISAKAAYYEAKNAVHRNEQYDYFEDVKVLCEVEKLIFNGAKNGHMEVKYDGKMSDYVRNVLKDEGYELRGDVISWTFAE